MFVITLNRDGAERAFQTNTVYQSVEIRGMGSNVDMDVHVLFEDPSNVMMIKTAECSAFDGALLAALNQAMPMNASLFIDKTNAEYTYDSQSQ